MLTATRLVAGRPVREIYVFDRVGLRAIPACLSSQRLRRHQCHAGDQGAGDGAVRERSPALSPSPLARGAARHCAAVGECGGVRGCRSIRTDPFSAMKSFLLSLSRGGY